MLNIENPIEKDHIQNLLYLVEHLTKSMHKNVPNSEVIWYDSVTINGELKWQNQLNDLNSPYFDVCDGIFLNYTWNEEGLASSVLFDLGMAHRTANTNCLVIYHASVTRQNVSIT